MLQSQSRFMHDTSQNMSSQPLDQNVIDPVCGMSVTPGTGKPTLRYKGTDYHFCNPKCHDRFDGDPYFYLSGNHHKKKALEAAQSKGGMQFTCPMDPEIVQDGPGTCPICGMALEPMGGISDEPKSRVGRFLAAPSGQCAGSCASASPDHGANDWPAHKKTGWVKGLPSFWRR